MMKNLLMTLLTVSMLSGCMAGNLFSIAAADELVPGETTLDEAVLILRGVNAFGQPAMGGQPAEPVGRRVNDDGTITYVWSYAAPDGAAKLELLFDSNGVLIKEVSRVRL